MEKRFSTFEGVFTPTLLSILGVIMYLRLGWVVGQVGLGGALLIIVISNCITLATALSLSSIVTNIRIGTGGAYSIISKSLGMEAGGAIGIPLYLSQAISVAFYIAGFTECWIWVFPQHYPLLVSLIVWSSIALISYFSAQLAFRMQYFIMAVVALSLVSVFLGSDPTHTSGIAWKGLGGVGFWAAFTIFFPAVTGVLAGASMSGELRDARSSIPKGTLSAVGVTFVIYIVLAVWLGWNLDPAKMVANTNIMIETGRWKFLVIGGVMGATLSSAMAMIVGAPRTLLALSEHRLVPFSRDFLKVSQRGEPVTAILFTVLIVLITLLMGSLDSVAGLLTEFFLITYGMINLSVFIEQSIGIVSFRPYFRIPKIISLFGSVGCFVVMWIVNPIFTAMAFTAVFIIYILFLRREMKTRSPDVRSGLLIFLAETFVKMASSLPYHPKTWKPNVIFPVHDVDSLKSVLPFLKGVIAPSGRLLVLKVFETSTAQEAHKYVLDKEQRSLLDEMRLKLTQALKSFKEEEFFVEQSVVEAHDETQGVVTSLQVTKEMFLRPNTLFYILDDQRNDEAVSYVLQRAAMEGLGLIVLKLDPKKAFGYQQVVNLWIRKGSPNIDLAVLIALQLSRNWEGKVRLIQAIYPEDDLQEAKEYLSRLRTLLRLPLDAEELVLRGDFRSALLAAPNADVNIFGMAQRPDIKLIRDFYDMAGTSVLFLRDSKHESAVA